MLDVDIVPQKTQRKGSIREDTNIEKKNWGSWSSLIKTPDLESGNRRFKSYRSHQK